MEYLLIVIGILVFFYILGSYDYHINEPLQDIDEGRLCNGPHQWESVYIIDYKKLKEFNSLKNNEDVVRFTKQLPRRPTCMNCGLISNMDSMLKPRYLQKVRNSVKAEKENHRRVEDIRELKEEFFQAYIESLGSPSMEEETLIRDGYELYASFVEQLPELLKQREFKRVMENLKNN